MGGVAAADWVMDIINSSAKERWSLTSTPKNLPRGTDQVRIMQSVKPALNCAGGVRVRRNLILTDSSKRGGILIGAPRVGQEEPVYEVFLLAAAGQFKGVS